jgi:Domain of unknown function (DUF4439)
VTVSGVPDWLPVESLQTALGAEHAAVWVLELTTAFVSAKLAPAVAEALAAHRASRDATARLLRDHGVRPVPTEAAYSTPAPIADEASAVAALVVAESDLTSSWRAVIERTDDAGLRKAALNSLTDSAVRAARWRLAAATGPLTVALPGDQG